jgi:hypothetical protein
MKLRFWNLLAVAFALVAGSLVASPARAANTWVLCTITEAGHMDANRVHVACSNSPGGFRYFAVRNADAELANRLLSFGTTSLVHGLDLYILFDPNDNSGPTFGCAVHDCRPAKAVAVTR